MRLTSLFLCMVVCIVAIKSDTRPKRDLETILKIKKAIAASIFGTPNCTTEKPQTVKVYRVPNHEHVLIKPLPIIRPQVTEIEMATVVKHPTIAKVASYLGTTTVGETLAALDRMQKLLQSGILTNITDETLETNAGVHFVPAAPGVMRPFYHNQASVYDTFATVQAYVPPSIAYSQAGAESLIIKEEHSAKIPAPPTLPPLQIPTVSVHENSMGSMFVGPHAPILDAPISLPEYVPSGYSYKQVHSDGSVTTYTAGHQNTVPELVRVPTVVERIPDVPLPVNVHIPCIHSGPCHLHEVFPPAAFTPVHVHEIPDTPQRGGYSYHQIHLDGSVSSYTDKPLKVPDGYGGYIYQKIKENGSFESFLDADCKQPLPTNYFSDRKPTGHIQKVNSEGSVTSNFIAHPLKLIAVPHYQGGYIYEQIHEDGSKTLYLDAEGKIKLPDNFLGKRIQPMPVMHPFMINRIQEIADTMSAEPKPEAPELPQRLGNPSGFVYKQMYGDGSITTFIGDKASHTWKQGNVQSVVDIPAPIITEMPHPVIIDSPEVPVPIYGGPDIIVPDYRPVDVRPILSPAKSHHHHFNHHHSHVHPGPVFVPPQEQPFVLEPIKPPAPIVRPEEIIVSNTQFGHGNSETNFNAENNVPSVNPSNNPTGFVYKQIFGDGSVTTFTGDQSINQPPIDGVAEFVEIPASIPEGIPHPMTMDYPVPVEVFEGPDVVVPDYQPVDVRPIPSEQSHHHSSHHAFVPVLPNPVFAPFPRPHEHVSIKPVPSVSVPPTKPQEDGKPIVSNYMYTQQGHDHSETKFSAMNPVVVNVKENTECEEECEPSENNLDINSEKDSFAKNPIIVAPEVPKGFSYTQTKDDGSSVSYEANDSEVSVNVNNNNVHRGDIP